jgi:predicted RNase H-like HicB family nuclease
MSDYHINVFYSDDDGSYVADIPDLEACSALGSSPEDALAEVERAKEAWLAAARDAGRPIPEPRYRPAISTRGSKASCSPGQTRLSGSAQVWA